MSRKSSNPRPVVLVSLLALLVLAAIDLPARQNADPGYVPPCEGKVWWSESKASFEDFDFWLGEWQVYDRESGQLMGIDRIEKIHRGCALQQHWSQMNDRFLTPGAPRRYSGGSFSALGADGKWHQTWLDASGGFLPVEGSLNDEGVMVLESADWIEFTTRDGRHLKLKYRWHWAPQEDGSIHNWGYQLRDGAESAEWQKYFDIVYRANKPGGPTAVLQPTAD